MCTQGCSPLAAVLSPATTAAVCLLQVYTAEYGGHLLALKLFRYSTAMDYSSSSQLHGGGGGPGAGGAGGPAAAAGIGSLLGHHGASGSSGGNVASEAELEAVLSLQYRLCNLSHTHLLQHVAVYPRVYEVSLLIPVWCCVRLWASCCPENQLMCMVSSKLWPGVASRYLVVSSA